MLIHTGDLTHLSTPKEFDTVAEILKGAKVGQVAYVPGEHDVIGDVASISNDSARAPRATAGTASTTGASISSAWSTSPSEGTDKGLGILGDEQLDWLKADLAALADSTPIVVFAHVPLLTVYPQWGWGTADGERRSASSSGSARSRCSTATSTRSSRRSRGT